MFILCPHCQFLVAIDPASGLPPANCPRCGEGLRAEEGPTTTTEPPAPSTAPAPTPSAAPTPAAPPRGKQTRSEPEASTLPSPSAAERALDTEVPDEVPDEMLVQPQADAPVVVEDIAAPAPLPAVIAPTSDDAATNDVDTRVADAVAEVEAAAPVPAPASPAPAPRRRTHAPSFARAPISTDTAVARRWQTPTALAALSLLLMLQVLLADRARLAMEARWRPSLATLCGVLRCSLPAWHEPEAFTLIARDVRPARPGVLHVTATFRNDARWTQAWPALHLALQDVDGGTIGARVFTPSEYLGGHETQNGLAPGQTTSIAFDVAEPPGTVVAFTFDFR